MQISGFAIHAYHHTTGVRKRGGRCFAPRVINLKVGSARTNEHSYFRASYRACPAGIKGCQESQPGLEPRTNEYKSLEAKISNEVRSEIWFAEFLPVIRIKCLKGLPKSKFYKYYSFVVYAERERVYQPPCINLPSPTTAGA